MAMSIWTAAKSLKRDSTAIELQILVCDFLLILLHFYRSLIGCHCIVNVTLSIDLTKSWMPNDVEIKEITRPQRMPVMTNQAIFIHAASNSFYVWGGYVAYKTTADLGVLWKFIADGEGSGAWSREAPADADLFIDLQQSENAAYVTTPNMAYAFGGRLVISDNASKTEENIKGYVSFDFNSLEWSEGSDDESYSQDGSLWGGTATYVERYGAGGIIVMLGGVTRRGEAASAYKSFGKVDVYDISARKWYSQSTTGDIPPQRFKHCAVSIGNKNNSDTHEM